MTDQAPLQIDPGTSVEVRTSLGSWAAGFEVVSVDPAGACRVRRCDGTELPDRFPPGEVRLAPPEGKPRA